MSDSKEHFELAPEGSPPHSPHHPAPISPPAKSAAASSLSPADAPPLLELQEDRCPKCNTSLRPEAVFCIKCGYDLRTNELRTPTLGVEHILEKPKEDPTEFSYLGRLKLPTLLGIGGAITVAAMVVAGLNAPPRFSPVLASVILSLYEIALHTGTGLIAILVASRIAEMKAGRLDLAAARVFIAFAAFQLVRSIVVPDYRLLSTILMYPLALATYWSLVMVLFKKPRMIAVMVMVVHFVLWLVVQLGVGLADYVSDASVPAPHPAVAPADVP